MFADVLVMMLKLGSFRYPMESKGGVPVSMDWV